MPALAKLNLRQLRNIEALTIRPTQSINVLYGANGSGKTSILEGIHLLGMARSFRSTQLNPLIQSGKDECTIYGELDDGLALGLTKGQRGKQVIRIGGKTADNAADLAFNLPLQLLNSDTFKILEGSPSVRRRFMDWGVFHVEHHFFQHWRQAQKALGQRNALLKSRAADAELAPWTQEFVRNAALMDDCRCRYVSKLLPVLDKILHELLNFEALALEYERGWAQGESLATVLERGLEKDRRYGYTTAGPQRADIRIKMGSNNAVDILSRGQQKLLVSGLKIAQGLLLQQETGKRCLFLVDDLPAELDRDNRAAVCGLLADLQHQVFLTCVEEEALAGCWPGSVEKQLFHVKHGKIR